MTASAGRRCAIIRGLLRALRANQAGIGRPHPETALAIMLAQCAQPRPARERSVQQGRTAG